MEQVQNIIAKYTVLFLIDPAVSELHSIGTLSIDNEMARRRRAEVQFSRVRVLRMCDVVKTSSSLRRRLNFSRISFW